MARGLVFDPVSPGSRRGHFVPFARQSEAAPPQPGATVGDRRSIGIRPVNVPRSPGWKPGDSGHENHPAIHASRPNVTPRFEPAMHGTRARIRPGVPRLPPGAFCVGYAHANPNAKLENAHEQTNDAASQQPSTTTRNRRSREIRPVNVPRSPGWKPGDSGHKHHPAIHASRPDVTPRFELAMHGTRARVRPGVPRLPPGAFCAVRARQSEGQTGKRARTNERRGSPATGHDGQRPPLQGKSTVRHRSKKPRVETRGLRA